MKKWVLLSVLSALLIVCAVHPLRRSTASDTADSIKTTERRTVPDGNDVDRQLKKLTEIVAENSVKTARESEQRQRETGLRQQEAEQLQSLDGQLRDLDKHIAQQRQNIETWYVQNLAALRRWAEQRNRELDNAQRAAYAQYLQQLKNTESVTNTRIHADAYASGSGYISRNGYVYGSGQATVDGYSIGTTNTRVVGDPAGWYSQYLAQIQEARRGVEQEFVRLEQQKKDYLATLDAERDRKKTTLNWYKGRVQRETERQLSPGPHLEIAAIIGTGSKFTALIGDRMVSEGNVVNGYTVRKIYANRVELEKNGEVIIQKVD